MAIQIDPKHIKVTALWSIYEGQYQVWYTVWGDDHNIPDVPFNLSSRSFYLDTPPKDGALHAPWVYLFDLDGDRWILSRTGKLRRKLAGNACMKTAR